MNKEEVVKRCIYKRRCYRLHFVSKDAGAHKDFISLEASRRGYRLHSLERSKTSFILKEAEVVTDFIRFVGSRSGHRLHLVLKEAGGIKTSFVL